MSGCCCLVFSSLPLVVISCLQLVSVMLLCFGLVMSLRCLLFLTSLFPFSSSIMYSNFSVTVAFSNIDSCHMAAQSPGHPFLILSGHGHFCHSVSFAFRILVFVSFALNGDRNFFIVGNTLLNCLRKNLCTGGIPVDFDGVLGNSTIAWHGSLFSLLHFLIMYFICFTAYSAIQLGFGLSGELGFHLNPYLWASSLIIWLSNSRPPSLTTSRLPYLMKCLLISLTVQPDDIP